MSYSENIFGWFKRFNRGVPLCQIPLHDTLEKTANVIETIRGDGTNIVIDKPLQLNGKGFVIRYIGPAGSDITISSTEQTYTNPQPIVTGITVDSSDKHKLVVTTSEIPSIPLGYEEVTHNIITDSGIFTCTILVKTVDKATVRAFETEDDKLLLGVGADGKLSIDRGYLV
jgi:hypothetical protein